ncbi:MAG: hypothetical protein A3J93_04220 [Candidatus Magasanikbacteria bacterium RIFOXYC2_FULL_42_28]|uniref:Haloacid dehalogenase n=1 Tax=Candidatus Magasanikbacteria bacterium RIFOXYC2_FULL_42_28 TaxID=1798704 RepID=A0A1F6NX92_9BACT|nr:MAG: hypothetical protein A3J93_04220 [Candidatus Magasanikbacteria bacterium RIFOXYC2_FULL_42_28]
MIKAIFFDMGGVICEEGFRSGIRQYEIEKNIPEGEFYRVVHDFQGWKDFTMGLITEKEYLNMCAQRAGQIPFDSECYVRVIDDLTIPNVAMIQYIKDISKQLATGIISNHPAEWYARFVQKTGLEKVLTARMVSGYEHLRKPDIKMFVGACAKAHVNPKEAAYVDDREDMLINCESIGMKGIVFDGNMDKLKQSINLLIN